MPARTNPCQDVNSFEIINFMAYAWSIISNGFTVNEPRLPAAFGQEIMGIPIFPDWEFFKQP